MVTQRILNVYLQVKSLAWKELLEKDALKNSTNIRVATLKHVFNIFFNIHQLTNCLVNKMLENSEKYSSNVPKMNLNIQIAYFVQTPPKSSSYYWKKHIW